MRYFLMSILVSLAFSTCSIVNAGEINSSPLSIDEFKSAWGSADRIFFAKSLDEFAEFIETGRKIKPLGKMHGLTSVLSYSRVRLTTLMKHDSRRRLLIIDVRYYTEPSLQRDMTEMISFAKSQKFDRVLIVGRRTNRAVEVHFDTAN